MTLIDRDAVIAKAQEDIPAYEVQMLEEFLDEFSTIDPESLRPKGEWVKISPSKIICSNCKNEPTYANLEGYILTKSCPNCGADMRGDNNGS